MAQEKKRIIYVDAGQNENKEFQIALYDPEINLTSIIKLIDITNNTIAERYAVLNAITYIKSKRINKTVILSDNEQVVRDNHIGKLCEKYKIKIAWIPREINIIADKVAKLQPTKKDDVFYTLEFIHDLIYPQKIVNQNNTNIIKKKSTNEANIPKQKI